MSAVKSVEIFEIGDTAPLRKRLNRLCGVEVVDEANGL